MIDDSEFLARRNKLKAKIAEQGARTLVITNPDSIYYLCGATFEALERPFFLVVSCDEAERLIVPFLEKDHMKKSRAVTHDNIFTYWEYPAPEDKSWKSALLEQGRLEQGFIYEPTCPAYISELFRQIGGHPVGLIEELRLIKSAAEIDMVRKAAYYADMGVQQLLDYSYFGSTVGEGFARTSKVTQAIIRNSPNWDVLSTKVLMGTFPAPVSAQPHSVPSIDDLLLEGPHVALVLTRANGYAAESERTYFTAPPSRQDKEYFSLMLEARKLGLGMVKPGIACGSIDAEVNHFLEKRGVGKPEQRLHRIGHGLGLGNHEGPWLSEGSTDVLEAGMIVSIEPGIYVSGVGGYRHSDTVLVTEDGYELLTKAPGVETPLVVNKKTIKHRIYHYMVNKAIGLRV